MPRFLRSLRIKTDTNPAAPEAGYMTLHYSENAFVPQLRSKFPGGNFKNMPYEFLYNVQDYGLAGFVGVDSSFAIQSCLDLAGANGGTVFLPPGEYEIANELEITGSVHLWLAPGAIVRRDSSAMQYMIKNFDAAYAPTLYGGRGGITIEGGIWDADGATLSTSCTVMVFAHADDINVRNVTIRNVPNWHAIEVNACRKVKIRDCTFEGFRVVTGGREMSEAVQIDLASGSGGLPGIGAGAYDNTPCFDVLVTGCTARGLGALGSYGKLVGSHAAVNTFEHENVRVLGNYAEDLNDFGVSAYNWNNVVVSDNTFVNCNGGVNIEIPAACTTDIERFTVSGNQFIGSGTQNNGTAIVQDCIKTRLTGTGVIRSVTIVGNIIKNFANITAIALSSSSDVVCNMNSIRNGTDATSVAIWADNSALGVYHGNKVDTVLGACMRFRNACTECVISGSVFNTASDGIELDSIRCIVSNNVFRISGAAKDGIQVTANGSDASIIGNFIRMSAGSAMDILIQTNTIKGWGITEGLPGPIRRIGTLDPAMSTTGLNAAAANINSYE
jgi:hypothetical protein